MPDALNITTLDGKYSVVLSDDGKLTARRYGQPWRDCVGDGLILTLAQDIETLSARNHELEQEIARITSKGTGIEGIDTEN